MHNARAEGFGQWIIASPRLATSAGQVGLHGIVSASLAEGGWRLARHCMQLHIPASASTSTSITDLVFSAVFEFANLIALIAIARSDSSIVRGGLECNCVRRSSLLLLIANELLFRIALGYAFFIVR